MDRTALCALDTGTEDEEIAYLNAERIVSYLLRKVSEEDTELSQKASTLLRMYHSVT